MGFGPQAWVFWLLIYTLMWLVITWICVKKRRKKKKNLRAVQLQLVFYYMFILSPLKKECKKSMKRLNHKTKQKKKEKSFLDSR